MWLRIPDATMSYIDGECKNDLERLRRVVRYWLLKDPSASWRRLIWELYYTDYDDLIKLAGTIKEYLEKLTGQHILSIGPLPCAPPLTPHWTTPLCPSTYFPLDHSHMPLHLLPIGPLPCALPLTPHWTTPMCPSTYSPLDHSHVPLHLLPIGPLPCAPPLTPHWTTPMCPSPLDHYHVAPVVETRPPCMYITSAHDKVPHVPHPVLFMFIQYTFSCRSQPDQQCCAILFGDCGGYGYTV